MHKSEYQNIFSLEQEHFYYVATHELVAGLVEKYGRSGNKILDAGCGTGGLMSKLNEMGYNTIGVDRSSDAIDYCRQRGVLATRASVDSLPLADESMDGIISVDVLYHLWVKKVDAAISEFERVLKPGGWLIIKVPAHNWIRTDHDKQVMTKRRFSLTEMKKLIASGGFEPIFTSWAHLPLLLVSILKMWSDRGDEKSGVVPLHSVVNSVLLFYFRLENWLLLRGVKLPWGNCIVVVGRKPSDRR